MHMKLVAMDLEDLNVVSAMVQDAVLKVGEIQYLPQEQQLLISMNRFVWEASKEGKGQNERRRTVLALARVQGVQAKKINMNRKDVVLSLLAVRFESENEPAGRLILEFSGGAAIAASVECLEVQLTDLGAAWATENKPHHQVD
ncbi:DUF2948 family protein [Flexibacterium corallicola]|uniref:DUF2948 family protein n=1 Tax=Flexibacterium corallicola TaxID=3037259 RepID=UPI00286F47FB|nr:DUF2948 family protein [Pseudovibrio sp. M1P-2-3]